MRFIFMYFGLGLITLLFVACAKSPWIFDGQDARLIVPGDAKLQNGTVIGAGGGGATTALDNLASVAVNDAIIPDTDEAYNLGGSSLHWDTIYGRTISSVGAGLDITAQDDTTLQVSSGGSLSVQITGGGDFVITDGSEGTSGHVWTSKGTAGEGNWAAAPAGGLDPTATARLFEEFICTAFTDSGGCTVEWSMNRSGAGTTAGIPNTGHIAGHPGIYAMDTGTTTTGYAVLNMNVSTNGVFLCDGGIMTLEFNVNINNVEGTGLSDGTDTYALLLGLQSNAANNEPAHGLYFLYDTGGAFSTGSTNYFIVGSDNSTRTETDSGSAVAVGYQTLKLTTNGDCTSTEFFVDGSSIGTVATNNPMGRRVSPMFKIIKSAGTNESRIDMDYVLFEQTVSR